MITEIIEDDFDRLPGLFRAWDFGMLLEQGRRYRIEDGGRTDDGQPLFMVFHGPKAPSDGGAIHDA